MSFFVLWAVVEGLTHDLSPERLRAFGYRAGAVLALTGIAGSYLGIRLLKKKPILAAALLGIFAVPGFIGLIVLIVGP